MSEMDRDQHMRPPFRYSIRTLLGYVVIASLMCCALRYPISPVATAVCSLTLLVVLAASVKCVAGGSRAVGAFVVGAGAYFLVMFGPFDPDFCDALASTRLLEYSYENLFAGATPAESAFNSMHPPYISDERRLCFVLIGQCYATLLCGYVSYVTASYFSKR